VAEDPDFLQKYRNNMDMPMEILASTLGELGWKGEGAADSEVVEVATRKLRTLHSMLLASGITAGMLQAVMAE
jgi:hypothetical protein